MAFCRRKENSDFTAFWSKRPRCHTKSSKDEWGDDMKGVRSVAANRCTRCCCACQVEKDAGIRPFFEPRKTWREDGNGPKHLPNAQDGEEIGWVHKYGHNAMRVGLILPDL